MCEAISLGDRTPDDPDEEYTGYVGRRLPWLRQIAYPLCQDWHRADDPVQSAITRLHVKWRHARLADDLDAYVRVILIRVFLTEQRSGWFKRVRLASAPTPPSVEIVDRDTAIYHAGSVHERCGVSPPPDATVTPAGES